MARRCIFCGGGPLTREHVYPKWLLAAIPKTALGKVRVTDEEGRLLWEQDNLNIRAKVVCGTCNSGWMSALEASCGPRLIGPILDGATLSLDVSEQREVALWAIKTVAVLEAQRRSGAIAHIPEWHTHWMPRTSAKAEHLDPPAGIRVSMFGRQPDLEDRRFAFNLSVAIAARDSPDDLKGYVATLVIGYVGFQVFGVNLQVSGTPTIRYGRWINERAISLWPSPGYPATWPPRLVLTTPEVEAFAELFGALA